MAKKKVAPLNPGDNIPLIFRGPGSRRFQPVSFRSEIVYDSAAKVWYVRARDYVESVHTSYLSAAERAAQERISSEDVRQPI